MDGGPREETSAILQRRLDEVTRLLCELCGKLDKTKVGKKQLSSELSKWWQQHQENDRARIREAQEREKRDRIRQDALAKLSAVERKALNLPNPSGGRPRRSKKRGG